MQVFERLKLIRKNVGEGQEVFAKNLGLKQGSYSDIERGRIATISESVMSLLELKYGVNTEWLKNEEGEMFKERSTPIGIQEPKGVPYYNVDFIGGFDISTNDQTISPSYFIDFYLYNKADHWVNITGRSMEPLISHGDIMALKGVDDWNTYLLYGEIYAIVTDEYRTVKKVRKSELGNDFVKLVPLNSEFDEQDIPKSIIRKVFQVLGTAKKIF